MLAGLANTSIGDGKHVIVVRVVVPGFVSAVRWSDDRACYKPNQSLGAISWVATCQCDTSGPLGACLNAVKPGSIPVRHVEVVWMMCFGKLVWLIDSALNRNVLFWS